MIVKIIFLFLAVMMVLGMFGRWKLRLPKPLDRAKLTTKCKACGRHKIGKGPCPCGKG